MLYDMLGLRTGSAGGRIMSVPLVVEFEVSIIDLIFESDFNACFALRENYFDRGSIQRQLCDLIGLTPRICPEIDVDKIF